MAGVAHAAYGTDGFAVAPFALDERRALAEVVDAGPEALVYLYTGCDRRSTYPQVGGRRGVVARDRFTGASRRLAPDEERALAEPTFANELDLMGHSPSFRDEHGAAIRSLFEGWREVVSEGAWASFEAALDPAWVGPRDGHVTVNDLRLHYLEWGRSSGPVILLLHGGGLNAHAWDRVCARLCPTYQCIAVDLRGHGDSDWSPEGDYGLAAHLLDLDVLVRELCLVQPVIVGHSLGGHAAMAYAADNATDLAGLVVVDTSPYVAHSPALAKIRAFVGGPSEFDSLDDAVEHARTFRPDADEGKLRRSVRHSLKLLPDGRWTWKRDRRHLDDAYFDEHIADVRALIPRIGDITCPTLVVRGEHGVAADDASRFVAGLPAGRLVTVPGAGHNVHSDDARALAAAIEEFLRQPGGGGLGTPMLL